MTETNPGTHVPAWAWLAYRRARMTGMTLMGRNPLCRGDAAMTLQQDWTSLQGLRKALQDPPRPVAEDAEGRVQWETILGRYWTPKGAGNDYIGRLAGEMLANVYDLDFIGATNGQAVVFDCGGNVGFFTRFALLSGAGKVVAFEPSPDNALCLRRNLEADIAAGKVVVIEKAAWKEPAALTFSTVNLRNPGGHHVVEEGSPGIQVQATSIDHSFQELGLSRLDYIKMDVEGAEVQALEGARETVGKFHPRLCVATEHTDDIFANSVAVIDKVRSIGPKYRYRCTEAHVYASPSRGSVLTPFSLLFY